MTSGADMHRPVTGLDSAIEQIKKIAWAAFLFTLPVTSFPFFPVMVGGGTVVRPLSLYPLFILFLLVTIPALLTKPIPKTFIALLPFLIIATASSLVSLFRGIEPVLGIPVYERVLRTMLTLGVGVVIYLTVTMFPESFKDLDFSLRWIFAGGSLGLLWGSMQAIYVLRFNPDWYNLLNNIQGYISSRRLLENRISGLTYEPNWFAEQISFLLLPWLLALVLYQRSVFPWRWRWLTVEWALLIWALTLIPFTYSRAGVLNTIMLTLFSIILFRIQNWAVKKRNTTGLKNSPKKRLGNLKILVEITLLVAILVVPVYFIGSRNAFFARAWDYWQGENFSMGGYLNYLGFGARIAYSRAALQTFNTFPFLGAGLGNYAFYFEEMLPYRPLAESPEVLHLITPEKGRNRLITPKNFYLRLLAETGALGTAAFAAFLVAILGCALFLWLSPDASERFWGAAGLNGLFTFSLAAFTFDSFAIPNMWVVFGLITAATWISKQEYKPDRDEL